MLFLLMLVGFFLCACVSAVLLHVVKGNKPLLSIQSDKNQKILVALHSWKQGGALQGALILSTVG